MAMLLRQLCSQLDIAAWFILTLQLKIEFLFEGKDKS